MNHKFICQLLLGIVFFLLVDLVNAGVSRLIFRQSLPLRDLTFIPIKFPSHLLETADHSTLLAEMSISTTHQQITW
jgi:hypothetical protein